MFCNANVFYILGFYIKDLDHGCCFALDSAKNVICTHDTDKCFPVKEASSRFETQFNGCLTLKRPNIVAEKCLKPYFNKAQVMQWDKSDIVFTKEDLKHGIFANVQTPQMKLRVVRAKRVGRFGQVVIRQKNPPGKLVIHVNHHFILQYLI